MRKLRNFMYRIKFRVGETLAEERGISTVELILVLVVNLTPQNRVWIA